MRHDPNWLKFMREQYPAGTRIRLESMEDSYAPISSGTEGTVKFVDDAGQIHMEWDNGRSLALIPGEDSFSKIPRPLQTLKLYMPLSVKRYEKGEWGSSEKGPTELNQRTIVSYNTSIFATILKVRMLEENERGLMKDYHENDSLNTKVHSYVFTVEQVEDRLMGVAECKIKEKLTEHELAVLKENILEQISGGFGEGLKQHPIKLDGDELYVSLWTDSKDWDIMTQDELETQGQWMGGMQFR